MVGKVRGRPIKGLYAREKGGVVYYSYRNPQTGREVGLGTDRAAAIAAVQLVARRVADDPVQRALNKIERPDATWSEHVTWFRSSHLPSLRRKTGAALSAATLALYDNSINKAATWDLRPVHSISRLECAALIEQQPSRTGQVLRGHLITIFATAVARGLRDDNPAEGTLKPNAVIQRERLTHPAYLAIHAAAPAWLQRAMTLSLLSLQRPGDLCALPRGSWDGTTWHVRQSKSQGAGYGLLRIKPHAELAQALNACLAHPVDTCDRLLAYVPQRKKRAKGREHWGELSDEILSRQFAALRDGCTHEDLRIAEGRVAPSYYEIKALGMRLYREAGRSEEWIQALAGHQDIATTRIYTGRHDEMWVDVELEGSGSA